MTKEEKELMTKVLCEQLPYGVIVNAFYKDGDVWKRDDRKLLGVYQHDGQVYLDGVYTSIDNVKPYLRPMSLMTEEEMEELKKLRSGLSWRKDVFRDIVLGIWYITDTIDYLNAKHFDVRGLIPRGLAIAAVGKDNPHTEKEGEE